MSSLFGRRIEVIIGNKVLVYPPLIINFELPFTDDEKENTGNITIYNLSKDTIDLVKKDAPLVLKSGYRDNIGTIGVFAVKEAYSRLEGIDKALVITVGEENSLWKTTKINRTWTAGVKASQIINDIVQSLGLTVASLTLAVDRQYPRGKTFFKTAKLALSELVADCKSSMRYSRGTLYITPIGQGKATGFVLNKTSGLVGSPEKVVDSDGKVTWKVVSLMNYQIEVGTIIKVESVSLNGMFRVKKATYQNNDTDHIVLMEVIGI
jgi:hypothetical protein